MAIRPTVPALLLTLLKSGLQAIVASSIYSDLQSAAAHASAGSSGMV